MAITLPSANDLRPRQGSPSGIGGISGAVPTAMPRVVRGAKGNAPAPIKPIAPVKDFSANVYESVSKTLDGVAGSLLDYRKVQLAKQEKESRTRLTNSEIDLAIFQAEKALEFQEDDDWQTMEERYGDQVAKKIDELSGGFSDPKVREVFLSKSKLHLLDGISRIRGEAWKKEKDHGLATLDARMNSLREAGLKDGDVAKYAGLMGDAIGAAVDSGYMTELQGVEATRKFGAELAVAKINLLEDKPYQQEKMLEALKPYLPEDVENELRGKIEKAKITVTADNLVAEMDLSAPVSELQAQVETIDDPELREAFTVKLAQAKRTYDTFQGGVKAELTNDWMRKIHDGRKDDGTRWTYLDISESERQTMGENAYQSFVKMSTGEQSFSKYNDPNLEATLISVAKRGGIEAGQVIQNMLISKGHMYRLTASKANEYLEISAKLMSGVSLSDDEDAYLTDEQTISARLNSTSFTSQEKNEIKSMLDVMARRAQASGKPMEPQQKLDALNKLIMDEEKNAFEQNMLGVRKEFSTSIFGEGIEDDFSTAAAPWYWFGDNEDELRQRMINWLLANPNASAEEAQVKVDEILAQ